MNQLFKKRYKHQLTLLVNDDKTFFETCYAIEKKSWNV